MALTDATTCRGLLPTREARMGLTLASLSTEAMMARALQGKGEGEEEGGRGGERRRKVMGLGTQASPLCCALLL